MLFILQAIWYNYYNRTNRKNKLVRINLTENYSNKHRLKSAWTDFINQSGITYLRDLEILAACRLHEPLDWSIQKIRTHLSNPHPNKPPLDHEKHLPCQSSPTGCLHLHSYKYQLYIQTKLINTPQQLEISITYVLECIDSLEHKTAALLSR